MVLKEEAIKILKDFYILTGGRISLHDTDYNEVASYPRNQSRFCSTVQNDNSVLSLCHLKDRAAFIEAKKTGEIKKYKCHCGLTEIVAPIYHYGEISGYFMLGQITDDNPLSLENIKSLNRLRISDDKVYESIPQVSEDKLGSILNILMVAAEYLTRTDSVRPTKDDLATSVKKYIHSHFNEDISVDFLSSYFDCSRAGLMNHFKAKFNTTVIKYLTEYRLKIATEKLISGNDSIIKISRHCGFTDQNYFTKVFIKYYKVSPSQYRILHNK